MNNHVPLYVLNGFLKFDRKLYQVFGLPLGRPIAFKSIIYAIVIGVIEIVIYITPVVGKSISWIPVGILIIIPIGLAWLLSDIGTEDRSPFSFFKSFFLYHFRKLEGDTHFRNRKIQKEREYSFGNYLIYKKTSKETPLSETEAIKNAEEEKKKALRYMERINNPADFFEKLRKEQEELENRKKRKWFFFKKGV